jgi:predicted lactoylglutathione lyase
MTATSIFVNIPTTDLERSKAFYEALGYSINPLFTDENAACIVISDTIYFMVLTREYLGTFTDKQIIDPKTQAQTSISFTRDSREDVDSILEKALAAGGSEPRPAQDYGFMYSRDLEDPDGNLLGFLYMAPEAAEKGPEAYLAEQGAGTSTASA